MRGQRYLQKKSHQCLSSAQSEGDYRYGEGFKRGTLESCRAPKELVELPGVVINCARDSRRAPWRMGGLRPIHVKRFAKRFDLTDQTTLPRSQRFGGTYRKRVEYVNNGLVLYGRYIASLPTHQLRTPSPTSTHPPPSLASSEIIMFRRVDDVCRWRGGSRCLSQCVCRRVDSRQ